MAGEAPGANSSITCLRHRRRVCEQLVISEATAKTHVAHILQKLGLRDRVQAVIYAYESGLVAPGSID